MLQVQNIIFSYNSEVVIATISFELTKGKNLAIIGESGCGKSTLLKLIYGLYDLEQGKILWNEKEVLGPKFNLIPGMDFMKYLAQDFDLMPYITVAENVGKYLSNIDKEKKEQRIQELLEIVEMVDYANVIAKNLSGGQMQRVALAKVLALEPEVLLLDEPFSHIDNFRKNSLRRKLFAYLKEREITTIIATHDSTDVLSFCDEVIILKNGQILEQGNPNYIYENPRNKYIATLFGEVNEIVIEGVSNLVYSHQLKIAAKSDLKVEVINSFFKGSHYLIESQYNDVVMYFDNEVEISVGKQVYLKIK
ncbi:ABC transporter ATP-binding protein [Flavobacterium sp. j3]|uniref:ABC transporter ATP-binding protein n=1 Tax=Flavobacterium aureirubrum TaxID=3133147 RepID=A0ABU9N4V1_9FLAO